MDYLQRQYGGSMKYRDFLKTKFPDTSPVGFNIEGGQLCPALFPFQRKIVDWALSRGRAALFCDTGLGKTLMQLEWARHVCERTNGRVLVLTPLAVAAQTVREGAKFGIEVTHCQSGADIGPGVNVTNYDRLHHFDPADFSGIVLDESSILKAFDGATRKKLTAFAGNILYRLACTATPAPNDLIELTNHAEFLDVMRRKEIEALFFTQDGNSTHKWRLKGHARADFWRWLSTWSVAVRSPADVGDTETNFVLPPLTLEQVTIPASAPEGQLFAVDARSLSDVRDAQRSSLTERVAKCAELVNGSDEPWIVWCNLNAESEALAKAIPDAVQVKGSDHERVKESALNGFSDGSIRVLVTKPSIAGFGMNWQHCAKVAFVGLSYSYEQTYQATRRCWRYGQTRPVTSYWIVSEAEGAVVDAVQAKERQSSEMFDQLAQHMRELQGGKQVKDETPYMEGESSGDGWTMYQGDCVERMAMIESGSVGLSVFSPPFPVMYAYTNSPHDMGNVGDIMTMVQQFTYALPDLMRVMSPGRTVAMHLVQYPLFQGRDGYSGIKDYRGAMITAMEEAGFHFYGEVTIEKSPEIAAVRTKDRGLLFKTLATNSAHLHMGRADYLLQFRAPGEPTPIRAGISEKYNPNGEGWITPEEWVEWASPVWYRQRPGVPGGIRETDVLNVKQARESDDERHLCPLQLGVVERCVKLWSAPGELVLDPFTGIGSTGHEALRLGRKFVGVELKKSYFDVACRNLRDAERAQSSTGDLFGVAS